jgi:hypothetical protein
MAVEGQAEGVDRSALLLMLSYIEAECRRLGATEAAHHAALAAAHVPHCQEGTPVAAAAARRRRAERLH